MTAFWDDRPSGSLNPFTRNSGRPRNRLLHIEGWPPERIVYFVGTWHTDEVMEWMPGLRTSPKGRRIDRGYFHDEIIYFLAGLWRAVSLGPEEGLGELVGDVAVRGYQMQQGPKKRGGDALSKVIADSLRRLTKSDPATRQTWRDVLNKLERDHLGLGVIEAIELGKRRRFVG